MTKIKLCGLSRDCDIEAVNELVPDAVGFVFAENSKRYVTPKRAEALRARLRDEILPVGVFADREIGLITDLVRRGIIGAVQLHGREDEAYIKALRESCSCTIIKAFCIRGKEDIRLANASSADYVLLDSGSGSGETFNWSFLEEIRRPYFLAGGLTPENVGEAIVRLHPFGVDASSCLETGGYKDKAKMTAFVRAVREQDVCKK